MVIPCGKYRGNANQCLFLFMDAIPTWSLDNLYEPVIEILALNGALRVRTGTYLLDVNSFTSWHSECSWVMLILA